MSVILARTREKLPYEIMALSFFFRFHHSFRCLSIHHFSFLTYVSCIKIGSLYERSATMYVFTVIEYYHGWLELLFPPYHFLRILSPFLRHIRLFPLLFLLTSRYYHISQPFILIVVWSHARWNFFSMASNSSDKIVEKPKVVDDLDKIKQFQSIPDVEWIW